MQIQSNLARPDYPSLDSNPHTAVGSKARTLLTQRCVTQLVSAHNPLTTRASEASVRKEFERSFQAAASDPKRFEALISEAFGPSYDKQVAEQLRQQALSGDFSFLPKVRFVAGETLHGANGAYDASSATVLLNQDLRCNGKLMAQTFIEEAGHHLDTLLNRADAQGDEGELFRRLLSGEKLSNAELAQIRADDDHGVIAVDGREVSVEFWNPFKAIAKAASSAADWVSDAADSVGKTAADGANAVTGWVSDAAAAVGDTASSAASTVASAATRVWNEAVSTANTVAHSATSAWDWTTAAVKTAWDWTTAAVKTAWDWTAQAAQSAWDWTTDASKTVWNAIADEGRRAWDAGRSLVTGAWQTAVGFVKNLAESAQRFGKGVGELFSGDAGRGLKDMGLAVLGVVQTGVDAVLMVGGKLISAVQTLIHLEQPGRELKPAEVAQLRAIFGDSIDYDAVRIKEGDAGLLTLSNREFTHGNTVYMPNGIDPAVLAHEMTHVWQHQNGGTDYMSEALLPRYVTSDEATAYDWTRSVPSQPWEDLNPEQQGAFIQTAVAQGVFASTPASFSRAPAGYSGSVSDLNNYLSDALDKIQSGKGAP